MKAEPEAGVRTCAWGYGRRPGQIRLEIGNRTERAQVDIREPGPESFDPGSFERTRDGYADAAVGPPCETRTFLGRGEPSSDGVAWTDRLDLRFQRTILA